MVALIDTHCHLAFDAFEADRPEVVTRARERGVSGCVCVAVDAASAEQAQRLSDEIPGWAHATSGLHPTEEACADLEAWEQVEAQLRSGQFVAVGETGLDAFHDTVALELQQASLERHLTLAIELDLPVVLHCRDAFEPLLDQLGPWAPRGLRGVLHCFTGSAEEAERTLGLGLHLGLGGIATFKPRADLRELAREMPLERLLVETDAPWLAPVPHRGRRNEPSFVRDVADCLAAEREMSIEAFANATTAAASALFGLSKPARL